ncbi:DNA topoisomerase 1 [Gottschalkia acidurici 9a]|uniref:DNA topoisomerase 1 n=1 Tax=Gottschalkia acidurici (strain ATCC 7906 / DSM 604 / BCRC 14475 / CIP 104303 / KCTC 5404 / NCIMB 10678 / 9a) TaxID=1128398 RepID=K0AXS9_GOTA9|nr:type I DNA topoisomerase [Gottschalkia acidurici]AFS78618.1 DNA topoisomerase 1 [Gottschalkia acidurici 9a]
MTKALVIVESPAKAKTIEKFLGKNYKVKASVGHIRDLPKSKLGIDIDEKFEPQYITIRGKGPVIKELKNEAKKADKIFLATDPDREGEAISWHLANILNMDQDKEIRIEFNEITKTAIKNAIKKPRKLDKDLIDAQQARRVLDRLVGYKISPLLWKKVRKGLSAGRVQSVATKLICDREKEIEEFIPKEYWSIDTVFTKQRKIQSIFLWKKDNGKEEKMELNNEEEVKEILDDIKDEKFIIEEVKKGKRTRNPYHPYTTSNLQQDASRRIGFSTKKTMIVAQQLYEGISIKGEGSVGLISYIRTDSTRVSEEARLNTKEFIKDEYGENYLGKGNLKTKNKKEAQDAHEAIRPTSVLRTPESIKDSLKPEQYKLYKLIWERFVASQMSPAQYETLTIKIKCGEYIFRASGSKIIFDGFLKVYNITDESKDTLLPDLKEGEECKLSELVPEQHFTQPPPRYTEASLVKTLEEMGIGRPSTYAPTISTILARGYVNLENKSFRPTELGEIVTDILKEFFKDIVNEEFTADMEEKLDRIEEGELQWKSVIEKFYDDFKKELDVAENEMSKIEIKEEVTDIECEKCGRFMVVKFGRYGKFLACPGYPDCKNAKPIVKDLGIDCPKCDGQVIERKSKKGRKFYGCSNYPECDFVSWDKPMKESCPKCKGILTEKGTKKGTLVKCINKDCDFKREENI